ncbi:unnamed protein product [Didymodactylos carnosus]|uniref:G domain-containing protein n=1 Tax=Didymodactylos carnosus TaxID=1234261 RepID=A0A815DVB4_9BILA|nr:unnamed protein product [Didymodactylos carnosus]CAF1298554.1 unnamed protein product [Didymodactylos carnosus]CAF3672086.1 unnamed protein product [Didymodactylos carnosus]CAF4118277.1 unnamed protein product [Didymodactylos carnosus]
MTNTTVPVSTFEEIVEKNDLPKVIVFGGGGLGKTTLVNNLTNAKFKISTNSNDGTFNFQGASINHNGNPILVVDSPGYRLNEDRWWNGVMQIKNIIGVIILHKYEHRNSGYGNFGYVLAYLKKWKGSKVKTFLLDHSGAVEKENYMADSIPVKSQEITSVSSEVQEWIRHLDNHPIHIILPVALIEQYQRQLDKNHELWSHHKREISEKVRIIESVEREKRELQVSHEELETAIAELPAKLAIYDDNCKGYLPNTPHWSQYLYSWLPVVRIFHLNLLRTKGEKDHKIVKGIIDCQKKKKK